jgi:hypothetical protein
MTPRDLSPRTGRRVTDEITQVSEFQVNGVPYWKAKLYLTKLGETQLWTIRNDTEWDHPFHLHGFFPWRLTNRVSHFGRWREGHHQPPNEEDVAVPGHVRRASRHVDVPLSQPRSCRRRADGHTTSRRCAHRSNAYPSTKRLATRVVVQVSRPRTRVPRLAFFIDRAPPELSTSMPRW